MSCKGHLREIGNVDEGVVEGGEDTGDAEDELAYTMLVLVVLLRATVF